jgi:hypothetical protein
MQPSIAMVDKSGHTKDGQAAAYSDRRCRCISASDRAAGSQLCRDAAATSCLIWQTRAGLWRSCRIYPWQAAEPAFRPWR